MYGTIPHGWARCLEGRAPSQAAHPQRRAPGGQDVAAPGVRQDAVRERRVREPRRQPKDARAVRAGLRPPPSRPSSSRRGRSCPRAAPSSSSTRSRRARRRSPPSSTSARTRPGTWWLRPARFWASPCTREAGTPSGR